MSVSHQHTSPTLQEPESDFDLTLDKQLQLQEECEETHLDSHVVKSIITQLRADLEQERKTREELSGKLASEAELRGSLHDMAEQCSSMKVELVASKQKSAEDEEAIALLRGKVEESRRGLMRLQAESRRKSLAPMTIDVASAKNKRQSMNFTPMTGSGFALPIPITAGHGMQHTTQDGTGSYTVSGQGEFTFVDTPPTPQSHPPTASSRFSGLFGGGGRTPSASSFSPPRPSPQKRLSASSTSSSVNEYAEQLESTRLQMEKLQEEVASMKEALEETRHELTESNEAREASEACVNALREFIAEHGVGDSQPVAVAANVGEFAHLPPPREVISLPPMPGMTTGAEEDTQPVRSTGWGGFGKMWGRTTKVSVTEKAFKPSRSSTDSSSMDESEPISPISETSSAYPYILRDDEHVSLRQGFKAGPGVTVS